MNGVYLGIHTYLQCRSAFSVTAGTFWAIDCLLCTWGWLACGEVTDESVRSVHLSTLDPDSTMAFIPSGVDKVTGDRAREVKSTSASIVFPFDWPMVVIIQGVYYVWDLSGTQQFRPGLLAPCHSRILLGNGRTKRNMNSNIHIVVQLLYLASIGTCNLAERDSD